MPALNLKPPVTDPIPVPKGDKVEIAFDNTSVQFKNLTFAGKVAENNGKKGFLLTIKVVK